MTLAKLKCMEGLNCPKNLKFCNSIISEPVVTWSVCELREWQWLKRRFLRAHPFLQVICIIVKIFQPSFLTASWDSSASTGKLYFHSFSSFLPLACCLLPCDMMKRIFCTAFPKMSHDRSHSMHGAVGLALSPGRNAEFLVIVLFSRLQEIQLDSLPLKQNLCNCIIHI